MVTCRTCLIDCEADAAKNLYIKLPENPDPEGCLADVLTEVTHIQLIKDDNFSETICGGCYGDLCNAQSFIRKARTSDQTIRNAIHLVNKDDTLTDTTENQQPLKNRSEADNESVDKSIRDNLKSPDLEVSSAMHISLEITNVTSLNESHLLNESDRFNESTRLIESHQVNDSSELSHNGSVTIDPDILVKEEMLDDYEIKQEPHSDDGVSMEFLDDSCTVENGTQTENEIKAETLTDMDTHEQSDRDENVSPHFNVVPYPYLNGHEDDEDVKPTEDELMSYASNVNTAKMLGEETSDLMCEHCGLALASKYAKYRHMKLHKAVLTHCILCSEVFKTRKTLKKHVISSHSYGEPLVCEVCNMSFVSFDELTLHRSVHLPIRPDLKCIVCQQANFSSPKQLKAHLYSHRETPIVTELICHPCNKIFLSKFTLKAHQKNSCPSSNQYKRLNAKTNGQDMRDVKPVIKVEKREVLAEGKKGRLRCLLCPRTFMYEYARTIHMEQHQIRRYPCLDCKFKFKRKEDLARHVASTHGDEDEDYV